MKWQNLYAMRELPIKRIALPAAIIMPISVLVFEITQKYASNAGEKWETLATTLEYLKAEYSPSLFWYYVSFLLFTAFVMIVEYGTPKTIKKHGDFEEFSLYVLGIQNKLPSNQDTLSQLADENIRWEAANSSKPVMRFISSILVILSGLIICHGTFIYIPSKILKFDSLERLFNMFFLLQ